MKIVINFFRIIRYFWLSLILILLFIISIEYFFNINFLNDTHNVMYFSFILGILTFPSILLFIPLQEYFGSVLAILTVCFYLYIQWFLIPSVIYNIFFYTLKKNKRVGAIVLNKKNK